MLEVGSIKTRSICMCLHHVEVRTHLLMVRAGSCRKCELRNWGGMYLGITCGLTQP